jgi:hypothetical protein
MKQANVYLLSYGLKIMFWGDKILKFWNWEILKSSQAEAASMVRSPQACSKVPV